MISEPDERKNGSAAEKPGARSFESRKEEEVF